MGASEALGSKEALALAEALPHMVWTADEAGRVMYLNARGAGYLGEEGRSRVEREGWAAAAGEDRAALEAAWELSVASGSQRFEAECRLTRVDGQARWHQIRARREGSRWVGACADTDELTRAREEATARMQERAEELTLANERLSLEALRQSEFVTTQTLLASANVDVDEFMELVVTRVGILTPATGAMVEVVEGDGLSSRAAFGPARRHLGVKVGMSGSFSGLSVRQGRVLYCKDAREDARVDQAACEGMEARSLVVAPLYCGGAAVGALSIISPEPKAFSEADIQTLVVMAGFVGSAIGRQMQFEQSNRLLLERSAALSELAEAKEQIEREKAALASQERRMRLILETSRDAFVAMDIAGLVTDWNREAEAVFGRSREEALGRPLVELIIPEREREGVDEQRERFLRGEPAEMFARRARVTGARANGEEFPMELSVKALGGAGRWEFCAFLQDISQRASEEREMRRQAQSDQLTGLPNRMAFEDRLNSAMERARRSKKPMALMYLDVDFFKTINDTHGHLAGDEALRCFARLARSRMRASDTLARLGGDEFAAIFEDLASLEDATLIAEKIVAAMGEGALVDGKRINLSVSAGVSFYHGDEEELSALIDRADKALYQVKRNGRNGFGVSP